MMRRTKGFTLIELIITISIIVILAGSLLSRVWFYQEQAEKAAMEQVASALQSSLVMQYGQLLTRGREAEVKNLLTENPVTWLMHKPPNYAGEFDDITLASIAPGSWGYDARTRDLVYVPSRNEYFVAGRDGHKWVRYHLRLEYASEQNQGAAKKNVLNISSLLFEPVEPYQWFIREEK